MMKRIVVELKINDLQIQAEADTACPVLMISKKLYISKFKSFYLRKSPYEFCNADQGKMEMAGSFQANVEVNGRSGEIRVYVAEQGPTTPLLGHEGLDIGFPKWRNTFLVNKIVLDKLETKAVELKNYLKHKYVKAFDNDMRDPISDIEVHLRLKNDAKPVFFGHRPVPYRIKQKYEDQLRQMVNEGILTKIEYSEWASPTVCRVKQDSSLRICMDPSRTVNPLLEEDPFGPEPVDDMLVRVGKWKFYSTIDLTGAFQQLKLDEESARIMVINTPLGLFKYDRLTYGIKTATAIFQKAMLSIVGHLRWLNVYVDDLIIGANDRQEMSEKLEKVFQILESRNVKVNERKCELMRTEIVFLGHLVSWDGIRPAPGRVDTIRKAEAPKNVKELQSYLGLLNYSMKFIPNLSKFLQIFHVLLEKDRKYVWTKKMQKSFEDSKILLSSDQMLIHYDPEKECVIYTDASDAGMAAVLCQPDDNGNFKPVWFNSRTLTKTERKYPILHRELLAIVYALEKSYKFIFGGKVMIFTDHQPLVPIVKAGLTQPTVHNRVQRYLIRITPFDLVLRYLEGKKNVLADFASRFPLENEERSEEDVQEENRALHVNCVHEKQNINLKMIAQETLVDRELQALKKSIISSKLDKNLSVYSSIFDELVVNDELISYEGRLIIPEKLRNSILRLLHGNHIGVVKMKQLARRYAYWPGMNAEIERVSSSCETCKTFNSDRQRKVWIPWPKAETPFERIHIDFFHLFDREFLLIVDAFTSWIEVRYMASTGAKNVVKALSDVFLIFGDAKTVVSDNGQPFASEEFESFLNQRQIELIHSPPYCPQSNGEAERSVQTVKNLLKKNLRMFDISQMNEILKAHRNTPLENGLTPAELMLSFSPRTELKKLVEKLETKHKPELTRLPKYRIFKTDEMAFLTNKNEPKEKVKIVKKIGQALYHVKIVRTGKERTAHCNQLMKFVENEEDKVAPVALENEVKQTSRPKRIIRKPSRYT